MTIQTQDKKDTTIQLLNSQDKMFVQTDTTEFDSSLIINISDSLWDVLQIDTTIDWDSLNLVGEESLKDNEFEIAIRNWIRNIDFLEDEPIYHISLPNWQSITADFDSWKLTIDNWRVIKYDIEIDWKKSIRKFWWVKKRVIWPLGVKNKRDSISVNGRIRFPFVVDINIKNKEIAHTYIIEELMKLWQNLQWKTQDFENYKSYYPEVWLWIKLFSIDWEEELDH